MLTRVQRWLARLGRAESSGAERRRNPALREAIDQVVAGTDPRIRAVSGYGRKLRPPVERMLAYLGACGNWFAAPIEVSVHGWSDQPLLRALFATAEDMQRLFGDCRELREFFARHPQCDAAFLGLSAIRHERRTLGMSLAGEMLQREVAQTQVSFTDHRLFGACGSEPELRANIERRGFELLVGTALEQIVDRHARHRGLAEEQHLLNLRLKALEHRSGAVDALFDAGGTHDEEIVRLRERVQHGRQALGEAQAQLATLDDYIECIGGVLGHPERHLTQKRISLRINRMNIKIDAAGEPCDELLFSEIAIGQHPPRVVLLVRYPRSALPAERDRFDEAQQQLGMPAFR